MQAIYQGYRQATRPEKRRILDEFCQGARCHRKPATRLLNSYRHELRLFQNLFLPSVKLLRKERVGARVRRRYAAPRTPLDRVLACPEVAPEVAAQLRRQRDGLDPFALARAIDHKLERIFALANPHQRPQASTAPPASVPVRRRVRPRLSLTPNAPAASRRPPSPGTSQTAR